MLRSLGCGDSLPTTSIRSKSRGITVPNLVISGVHCTSLVLCASFAQLSDSVSALGAEVLVTCSVTTWKALQPSTILKWPLLFSRSCMKQPTGNSA